ncbi:MAG TPA: hypothetical protein VHE81_03855, partial [Lacipirellulaceae bacterium]|nr:hypothetical protein [Lacipirellulaceae bacterium]
RGCACIPDFGRFWLRSAHALLRQNLPQPALTRRPSVTGSTGSHADCCLLLCELYVFVQK